MNIKLQGNLDTNNSYQNIIIPIIVKDKVMHYKSDLLSNEDKKLIDSILDFKLDKSEFNNEVITNFSNNKLKTIIIAPIKNNPIKISDLNSYVGDLISFLNTKKVNQSILDLNIFDGVFSKDIIIKYSSLISILSNYEFSKYKTNNGKNTLKELSILLKGANDFEDILKESKLEAEGIITARDLVNEPANIMTPKALSERALADGKKFGYDVEVLEEDRIKELKMDSYLSVSKGSSNKPHFIVMKFLNNPDSEDKYGLVGKGLTFDTGGYSIKPTNGMLNMKTDMGGAAAVIGAMNIIASNNLKVNIVAVIPACENMISSNAYRPGDIIPSMSGKYIEVTNTDAEGRLTLVDGVTYCIREEKVNKLIDIATLTGAALVALGKDVSPFISSCDEMTKDFLSSSKHSIDKIWELPCEDSYINLLDSKVADIKNSGERLAGTIVAGLFIKDFTEDIPWVHFDIAGTAWTDKKLKYSAPGGTGAGVSLIYNYFKSKSD